MGAGRQAPSDLTFLSPVSANATTLYVDALQLVLGNLGPGDYIIELCARAGDESAQQYVAFRVLR
jgi:hypothetical protein